VDRTLQVKPSELEKEIQDYDARLIREAKRLLFLQEQGDNWRNLDKQIGVMDELQAHRRIILARYHALGGDVVNVHNFGAYVAGTGNEEEAS